MPKSLFNPLPKKMTHQKIPPWRGFRVFLQHDFLLLLVFILIALIIGFFIQHIWWSLFIACSLFFALQLHSLFKLSQWITQNQDQDPPKLRGVWGVLINNVAHVQQQQAQLHQEVRNLIKQVRHSLKNLTEGIVLINDQDLIEWGNLTAIELLAIDQPNFGQNILDVLKDQQFSEYFKNPDFFPDGIKILSPEYQNRYVQLKLTQFGQDRRLLIAYDVTRVHNLEQMRKDFVDNVSHELRTPLTVLSGYIETFKDQEDLPPRWEKAFIQMQAQTKRMTTLVNDLLLLSNLENHKNSVKHQLIEMPTLMNHIFDDAQAYNVDYAHTLNLEIDSHYDLLGAEAELSSAFTNLITNAIKYTPSGGTITIGWHDHEEGAFFSVQDTGIGIHPDHLPRLTERFYRVDTARSRLTGGTGLGLAIVKHVLIQHDARLEIYSEEGQGSLFKVIFPQHRLYTHHESTPEFIDN